MSLKHWIRGMLVFGSLYLFADAVIHLLNIRLVDVLPIWPETAIAYSGFISQLYSSFVFLAAVIVWVIQKDLKKYAPIILICGLWAIWHGLFLLYQTATVVQSFSGVSSLYVWSPLYPMVVGFEGILLIVFGTMVLLWRFKNGKDS